MKIPSGMTREETIERINTVINRIAPKYTFKDYEVDDIRQEAFIICMDGLNRYDESRPLENFLSVHLSNRLKNFIRDNHFLKDDQERKKVLAPKYLTSEDEISKEETTIDKNIDIKNAKKLIDKFLPCELRSDYLKILNEVYVPKKRKILVFSAIKDILEEHGYE